MVVTDTQCPGGYVDIDNSASQEIYRLKKGPKIVWQEALGATIQGSSGHSVLPLSTYSKLQYILNERIKFWGGSERCSNWIKLDTTNSFETTHSSLNFNPYVQLLIKSGAFEKLCTLKIFLKTFHPCDSYFSLPRGPQNRLFYIVAWVL